MSRTAAEVLFAGNDQLVELRGLTDEATGEPLNAATVTATLTEADGDAVTGATWPMTLAYVAESEGVYRATLPYGLGLVPGGRYLLRIDVNAGSGLRGRWDVPCVCRNRS